MVPPIEERNQSGEQKSSNSDRPRFSSPPKARDSSAQASYQPAAGKGSVRRRSQQGEAGKPLGSEGRGERVVDVVLSECEGEYGPRTSSPDNRGIVYS